LGIGDWGLGIGDWAQSPIPNPQSPFKNHKIFNYNVKLNDILILKYIFFIINLIKIK
jgi:hypothetical protein